MQVQSLKQIPVLFENIIGIKATYKIARTKIARIIFPQGLLYLESERKAYKQRTANWRGQI